VLFKFSLDFLAVAENIITIAKVNHSPRCRCYQNCEIKANYCLLELVDVDVDLVDVDLIDVDVVIDVVDAQVLENFEY